MVSPNKLILLIWGFASSIWFILPFQLIEKQYSTYGLLILILFIVFFLVGGSIVKTRQSAIPINSSFKLKNSFFIISIVSLISTVFLLIETKSNFSFNLLDTYTNRSENAQALLRGDISNSSLAFKIAFLTYPAAYIYIALACLYSKKINVIKILFFGFLPVMLCALSMGGRVQIFYSFLVFYFSLKLRNRFFDVLKVNRLPKFRFTVRRIFWLTSVIVVLIITTIYFINVFFVRAESVGGSEGMFKVAEQIWGIGFNGYLSNFLFNVFNIDYIFILFIFSWYISQGFVMSNIIFESYDGPLQFGVYGIEIITALARRVDGLKVYENFEILMDLGTYGFLPSAFGSLFIDFGFFALIITFFWGWWSMKVYKKTKAKNYKSMLLYPFMTIGIILSLINTPLGMTNGFVTFFWLFIAYYLIRVNKKIESKI